MTTITGTYTNHAIGHPDKIAIHTPSQTIHYREWSRMVCQTANWIDSIAETGATVGIFMPNGIAFLQLFSGIAMAGRTAATFDAKWKPAELEQRLTVSSPSVLITTKELAERIQNTDAHIILWEDALKQISTCMPSCALTVDGETPFYLGFTSGTTGLPKAFVRSHRSWVESFACNQRDFHLDENDGVLIPGALIHSHFLYGAISTLYAGGTIYVMESFTPTLALKWMDTLPVTAMFVVPTMVEAILKENVLIQKPMTIISSGAKWEEGSKEQIRERFPHLTMYEFYGASELSFVSFLSDEGNRQKPNSVGQPFHNVEIQIRLEDGKMALAGEIGKIFVRSTMLFSGYLEPRSRTIQSIEDEAGWVTVDDMGYLDENGFLYVIGREKNMILSGGVNLFPEEIEAVLLQHPAVKEVAVVGLEDSYWGQIPIALIKGSAPKKELKRLCREKLSAYKIPRKWFFIDELPYTTSGKIARSQVQQFIEAEVLVLE
ncbi:AMP-binding protein [Sporosarcina sp. ACRSM]|uniref:AMP-binding protein n=1 Tax=Sporosarcina sp. ACRSM TaxID=2918216 RepID=UPI001EF72C73|nr:AMP-binding protein [Sporosarcina sp. ACRSM]MCG7337556.1 AMP-binding protein [Sporosarcina sp. ACRSM]